MPPILLISHTDGDNLPAEDWNDNFEAIENALFDMGPYVISGLVPSAGAGLSVDVTAGTASIGGRVTFAGFNIAGLTPSSVNHLYVLQDGTATSNTTGTAPALSAKLGTATTDATSVTAVDTTPASGRQTKVDLSGVIVASAANAFTAIQTITVTDASGAAVSRPLVLRHANSGGVGANGIGTGIHLQVETSTEGLFETAAQIDARTTAATAGAVTAVLDLKVTTAGVVSTPVIIAAASVELAEGVNLKAGTVTGTKIGTATSEKLSFWNATPVAQQILATGGGATVDNVISLLQTLGLCRQS